MQGLERGLNSRKIKRSERVVVFGYRILINFVGHLNVYGWPLSHIVPELVEAAARW